MTSIRSGGHSSRRTAILFLGVAAASVAALVWMGVRLVEQDRALEAQQLRDRREAAADRLVALLELALSAEEERLTDPARPNLPLSDADVVLVRAAVSGSPEFRVWPEKGLLYYPEVPPGREASSGLYADAERSEFIDRDYDRAVSRLLPLSESPDPAIRAGAKLRLARNYRKAANFDSALEVYSEMAGSADRGISLGGAPMDLAARRARCALLEELGRKADLQKDALSLGQGLEDGRWRLDRASYLYYRDQTARWLGGDQAPDVERWALAEAVIWLWENRRTIAGEESGPPQRRSIRANGLAVTILWRRAGGQLDLLAAGPGYQRSQWFDPLGGNRDLSAVRVTIREPEGGSVYGDEPAGGVPVASRLASVTGLPWNIILATADPDAVLGGFAQRRRLLLIGLGMLGLLVVAASYLIGRAVSRELAAAQLQSDFVSAVSHEFRTPLTSIRQFTEMLIEDENLPKEKRRAFYDAQERSTRRLSRLVESLLDFGRMEAGARPYRLERLDAGRLVQETADEFIQETGRAGLVMDCRVPPEGPMVKADREALAQAVWNLLDNAVKYSGEHAAVHVEVEAGDKVAIRVRDEGIGIPPSERKRILRKFVRGSSAKAYGVKGTGIGLAMVKHIMDAHGGKVLVASEPGRGSTFALILPAGE